MSRDRERIDWPGTAYAFAVGLCLAVLVCWRAIEGGAARVMGTDAPEPWPFLWGHAWTRHALLVEHRLPFHTTWVDFPAGGTLWLEDSLSTLALLPVQLLAGVEAAYDLSFVLHLSLACAAAFLWARAVGAGRLAALLVAPLYAFMPHTLGEAWNGNVEAVSTAFLPLWGAALLGVVHRPDRARVARAAVCLLLLVWSNQDGALAMALTSPVLLVVALSQHRDAWRRRLGAVALAVALGALLSAPIIAGVVLSLRATDSLTFIDSGGITLQEPYLTDLLHLLQPLRPLSGQPATTLHDIAYPGWLLVATALAAPLRRPRSPWAWALPALGIFGVVLSVGPAAAFDGRLLTGADGDPIFLPWAWLIGGTPLLDSMTLPHRFAVPATAFLVGGAGLTLQALAERSPPTGRWLAAGVALVVALELALVPGIPLPLPAVPLQHAAHAVLLADDPSGGPVLNLPIRSGKNSARIMLWHQAVHGHATNQTLRHGGRPAAVATTAIARWSWEWEQRLTRNPDPDALEAPAAHSLPSPAEQGFGTVVLHADQLADLVGSDPDRHARLVALWAALLLPDLGPAVGLPDHTLVVTLDPDARASVEARALARWGDAVQHVEVPEDWTSWQAAPTATPPDP